MMRYNFTIVHVPGKALVVADALSRAPLQSDVTDSFNLQESTETFISTVVKALPASVSRLEQIAKTPSTDPILQQVKKYSQEGWPTNYMIKSSLMDAYIVSYQCIITCYCMFIGYKSYMPLAGHTGLHT